MKADTEVMQPQVKECLKPPEVKKANIDFSLKVSGGKTNLPIT